MPKTVLVGANFASHAVQKQLPGAKQGDEEETLVTPRRHPKRPERKDPENGTAPSLRTVETKNA